MSWFNREKLVVVILGITILLIASSMISQVPNNLVPAPSTPVTLVASRPATLSGVLQFRSRTSGSISTSAGSVSVRSGDTVAIVFNASNGILWIGTDGYISITGLNALEIYINNNKVLGATTITGTGGIQVDHASIKTSLTLTINGKGWTELTYNGQTVIRGQHSGLITIPNIGATSSIALSLNIGNNNAYLSATSDEPRLGTTTTVVTSPTTTTPRTTTTPTTTTVVTSPTTPSPTITTVTSVVPVTLSTVVSVPVTVSVTFTVTSPISTVVPVTHTTTVPVTIIRTITITQTRTTTITTTTPTTTVVTTTPRTTTSPTTTTPRTTTTPSPTLTTSPTTPRTIITVVADSNNVFPWECLDTDGNGVCEFMLEGNLWNCPGITRGNVQLIAKVYGSKDYQLDVSVDVNYSGTGGWVHGYPEIWVGGKPWNDYGPAPEGFIGERVNLPIKVRDITRGNVDLCVYVESYSITHTDKRVLYNFAFETWLTRDTTRGRGVRDNEVELMVWFSYHGLQGAGDVAEVVPITVYVDQLKVSQRFEIWHGNMGWEYFAFRSTVPRTSGRYLAWCWDDFLVAAGRHTYLSGWEDLYFTVSELGTEFGGVKVPWAYLKWSIKNYWLSKGLYLPVQITGEYQPQEVALGSCSGDVCPVKVNAGRPANLSGYMEFKVGYSGQITTNKGTINVKEGDIVKIEFNSVGGRIVIPRDGWTSMSEVGVSAIYLNNQKVVENAVITGSSFRIDFSSIKSELKAILWGSGWTNVTYNGIAHLEEANSNPIIIPKLTASPNQQLYIGITVSSDSKTTDIEGLSAPPIRVLW